MVQLRAVLDVLRSDADTDSPRAPDRPLADFPALVEPAARPVERGVRPALPAHVELAAYRTVQEALTNVRRHAPDARAGVEVVRWAHHRDAALSRPPTPGGLARTPGGGCASGHLLCLTDGNATLD